MIKVSRKYLIYFLAMNILALIVQFGAHWLNLHHNWPEMLIPSTILALVIYLLSLGMDWNAVFPNKKKEFKLGESTGFIVCRKYSVCVLIMSILLPFALEFTHWLNVKQNKLSIAIILTLAFVILYLISLIVIWQDATTSKNKRSNSFS